MNKHPNQDNTLFRKCLELDFNSMKNIGHKALSNDTPGTTNLAGNFSAVSEMKHARGRKLPPYYQIILFVF
jgi:hypothetical protein